MLKKTPLLISQLRQTSCPLVILGSRKSGPFPNLRNKNWQHLDRTTCWDMLGLSDAVKDSDIHLLLPLLLLLLPCCPYFVTSHAPASALQLGKWRTGLYAACQAPGCKSNQCSQTMVSTWPSFWVKSGWWRNLKIQRIVVTSGWIAFYYLFNTFCWFLIRFTTFNVFLTFL